MLIRGRDLTARQVEQVKAAYVHRNTFEHPFPAFGNTKVSDAEWINAHAFEFVKDGSRLSERRNYALPVEWIAKSL